MRRIRAVGEAAVPDWVQRAARKFEYPDFDTFAPAVDPGGGGGAPTIVIAAENSIDIEKRKADLICTGLNDQDVIQQALNELLFGGRLLLCAGTFNISFNGTPNCIKTGGFSGVTLEGMGAGFSTILNVTDSFSGSVLDQFALEFSDAADIEVKNLTLQGGALSGGATNGIAIGNQGWISNVVVATRGFGIQMEDGEVIVESSQIISGSDGVRVFGDHGQVINCHIFPGGRGVSVGNVRRVVIAANNIEAGTDGLTLTAADQANVYGNIIVPGITPTNTFDGIRIDGSSLIGRHYIHDNIVIGSLLANKPRYGINIATGDCNIVVGNDLGDPANYITDALNDAGTDTQLFYPNDPTYGDNFTLCPPSSP